MNLPDAAAEFARQLVTALAGDAVKGEPKASVRELADYATARGIIASERAARLRAETERDRLRGAVQEVLRQEGDLLSADRAQLLRDALGEADPGPDRWPNGRRVSHAEARRAHRDSELVNYELFAAACGVVNAPRFREGNWPTVNRLREVVERIQRERSSG